MSWLDVTAEVRGMVQCVSHVGGIKLLIGTSLPAIYIFASYFSLRLLSGTSVGSTLSVYPLALRTGLLEWFPAVLR